MYYPRYWELWGNGPDAWKIFNNLSKTSILHSKKYEAGKDLAKIFPISSKQKNNCEFLIVVEDTRAKPTALAAFNDLSINILLSSIILNQNA